NRNLRDLVTQGQFREDLFYRINVIQLVVPPLRERKEHIPVLLSHFMHLFSNGQRNGHGTKPIREITAEALNALCDYSWRGNVRELQNVVERLVGNGRSEAVSIEELPAEIRERQGKLLRPIRERRRTIADDLYKRLVKDGESFWSAVYPLYM